MTTEAHTNPTDAAPVAQPGPAPRRHRPRVWLGVLGTLAAIIAGIWYTHQPAVAASHKLDTSGVVEVHSALAMRRDVPVYQEGLGTVQAFYTVTMTARVDGELMDVYFKEGQLVRKGQLLAQIDPRPYQAALDQAVATEAKDAAQLQSARQDLERYVELEPQNLSSKQQVGDQRALVAQLAAQVQIDRALISNARTQLDYTHITSPITGRTGIRLIDPGNNLLSSSTNGIVVVTQMQPIAVIFTLPESALGVINRALAAGPVKVMALSQDGKTLLDTGTVTVVDNQIDPTTGTMRVKATFPNPHDTLWPGEFVNAQVLVSEQRNVVTIPTDAVQTGPDGPFTYVIDANSTVQPRPITLGVQAGTFTQIVSGLTAGERVVTSNQFRLEPGSKVHTL